jgi:hypothetical protein
MGGGHPRRRLAAEVKFNGGRLGSEPPPKAAAHAR